MILQVDWNVQGDNKGKANKDWINAAGNFTLGKTNPRGIDCSNLPQKTILLLSTHSTHKRISEKLLDTHQVA